MQASVSYSVLMKNIQHPPNIFKPTIYIVACELDSPSRRIPSNIHCDTSIESLHWTAKLRRISWIDLGLTQLDARLQTIGWIVLTSLPSTPHIHHQVFLFSTSWLLEENTADGRDGRTSPLPTARSFTGRQHTSMECRWISR